MAVSVYMKRLAAVRALMRKKKLDALIIPSADPHLGEYVPDHWRVIRWLTGFTGSAGNVVITRTFAGLWTDSRYFIQAEEQLVGSGFELVRLKVPHTPEHIDWLKEKARKGWKVGVDGRLISVVIMKLLISSLKASGATLNLKADLITPLWKDRPDLPGDSAFELDVKYAGLTRLEKLERVREVMKTMKVDYQLLTATDDIMWLLNLRGNDVKYSPLLLSYAVVSPSQVIFFADEEKIPHEVKASLDSDSVVLLPYETVTSVLSHLEEGSVVLLSPPSTPAALYRALPRSVDIAEDLSIPTRMKAVKNEVELKNLRKVMVDDGVVLTRFFFWLEKSVGREEITEMSAAAKIDEMRSTQTGCTGPSFSTIAAYNEHAAKGYQLDILARKPLWDNYMNYGHGTGHGVGSFLNVHEGPQTIGTSASGDMKTSMEPGMVISDEPAFYRPGHYGFRTENLLVCCTDTESEFGSFLSFETVTLCYIDRELIDISLLDDSELQWLNGYHEKVYRSLHRYLEPELQIWLRAKTMPLSR
ncbi:MAG: aminopeptidase P family N-terminal domain-containing protein [Bacteroidales bacterium]|nr:aminopeptidase P family N-terminal domain-containing protein [Bacteroidales bacterium]